MEYRVIEVSGEYFVLEDFNHLKQGGWKQLAAHAGMRRRLMRIVAPLPVYSVFEHKAL